MNRQLFKYLSNRLERLLNIKMSKSSDFSPHYTNYSLISVILHKSIFGYSKAYDKRNSRHCAQKLIFCRTNVLKMVIVLCCFVLSQEFPPAPLTLLLPLSVWNRKSVLSGCRCPSVIRKREVGMEHNRIWQRLLCGVFVPLWTWMEFCHAHFNRQLFIFSRV